MLTRDARSRMLFYVRLALGLCLLLLLIEFVDVERMRPVVDSRQPHLLLLGFLGILLNYFLMAYRWALILRTQNPAINLSKLVRFHFMSGFLGTFVPVSMSSDLLKMYCASQHTGDTKGAISSVLLDRVIGGLSAAIVAMLAFLVLVQTDILVPGAMLILYGSMVCLLGGIAILAVGWMVRSVDALRGAFARFSSVRLVRGISDLYEHALTYRDHPAVMAKVLGVSFLNRLVAILTFYAIARGFSIETSIAYFLLLIPLASLLAMLPVSVGGLGVLEAAIVFFFSQVGMSVEACLTLALAHRALLLVATLPGAVIYVLEGFPARALSPVRRLEPHPEASPSARQTE